MNVKNAAQIRQRKERKWLIGSAIFVVLVILAGLVLTATKHTEDPFANMSDIVDMRQMLATTNQADVLAGADPAAPVPANSIRSAGITWSAFGEVLYDLWFMCAATAGVIVISYLIKALAGLTARRIGMTPPAPVEHYRHVPTIPPTA